MRDIGLARRQLLTGLIFTVGSIFLLGTTLIPECGRLKSHNQHDLNPSVLESEVPEWSVGPGMPPIKSVLGKSLGKLAESAHLTLTDVDAQLAYANPEPDFPGEIQRLPVTIDYMGTAEQLKDFMQRLFRKYPFSRLQHMEVQPLVGAPMASRQLEGEIKLEMRFRKS